MRMNVDEKRGRPNTRWLNMIENNIRATGVCMCVCVRDVEDRDKWRSWTRVLTLNSGEENKEEK